MNEGGIDKAKQQSSGAALPFIGGCNVAVVVCQRRGIVHPQLRVAVLLARRLVNSADGDARCPEDAIMLSYIIYVFKRILESSVPVHNLFFFLLL